jgi:hypothetical protein
MKFWTELTAGALLGVAIAAAVVYGVIELTDYAMELLP